MPVRNLIDKIPEKLSPHPKSPHFMDLTGQRFARLTVVAYAFKRGGSCWYVRCDCGNLKVLIGTALTGGRTRSCGCYNRDALTQSKRTHGHSVGRMPTPEFKAYHRAKWSCTSPKSKSYALYGGRGIEFRFTSLEQFIDDVGERPSPKHWLRRIDRNGHYEPGNIRWVEVKCPN